MIEAIWLGQSEPTEWSRELEWNRWYSRTHQPEDLAPTPGLVQYGRLLNLTPELNTQSPGCKYAVLYDFVTPSIIDPLATIMDIDAETVREGRHFEAHRGCGGGFLGARADAHDSGSLGATRAHGIEDLERTLAATAVPGPPAYEPHKAGYRPPVHDHGYYVSLVTSEAPDDELRSWLAHGYPVDLSGIEGVGDVRCYVSIQRSNIYRAAIFITVQHSDVRVVAGEIIAREIEHARREGRPAGVAQTGISFQSIDPAGLEPLEIIDYPTDPALFPYLVDDSIGRFMADIASPLAGAS